MKDVLEMLKKLVKEQPKKFVFYEPTDIDKIKNFEQEYKVVLPESYKTFLLNFNGGFIGDSDEEPDLDNEIKIYIGWGYNQFLGIEDLALQYQDYLEEDDAITLESGFQYKDFIPFMLTDNNEKLSFKNEPSKKSESAVYDCFHEILPREWNTVYDSFEDLLKEYIKEDGMIETVG